MQDELEEKSLEYLANIDDGIDQLNERMPDIPSSFVNGIFQGMGILIGSLFAVTLIGWLLSFLGIIPGLGEFAEYLRGLMFTALER